jgi:hypothetical protein
LPFGGRSDNAAGRGGLAVLNGGRRLLRATDRFRAAQHDYVEGPETVSGDQHVFLEMIVEQRRALFFKIPDDLISG